MFVTVPNVQAAGVRRAVVADSPDTVSNFSTHCNAGEPVQHSAQNGPEAGVCGVFAGAGADADRFGAAGLKVGVSGGDSQR